MNKVVLFPSPRSFSRTDSRGREIPPNCPPPASLVLCVQQASTSTRFASHVDMHCCSFSNDVVCLLWIKWNDRKEQRQKRTKKSACWYLWSSSKRCLKSVTRTLTCFMCPERLVQLLSVGKRNRQKQVMWKLQEVYILHLFFSFVVGDNHHNSLSCISYFLSQNFGLMFNGNNRITKWPRESTERYAP